eukprot:3517054-Pyramimonas_sp.AAC.2
MNRSPALPVRREREEVGMVSARRYLCPFVTTNPTRSDATIFRMPLAPLRLEPHPRQQGSLVLRVDGGAVAWGCFLKGTYCPQGLGCGDDNTQAIHDIVKLAVTHGVEAIHPGYGFLSERADFARLCKENGITFVGPDPETLDQMGDKTAARAVAIGLGIPVIPGK